MNPAQRASRQHDLLLAADVLRREMNASLTSLQPAAEPVLHGLAIGLWLRRHRATSGAWAAALAVAAGGAVGGSRFALRHRRWLRRAWIAWRLWQLVRR
jgi:hypothetical protein